MFPAESCEGDRPECAPHAPEVSDETVAAVAHYMATLGVPERRNLDDAEATRGEAIFYQAGCATCHQPTFTTGSARGHPVGLESGDSPVHRPAAARHGQ